MIKKKGKEFVIKIFCANCNTPLYKYKKVGAGALIKCYLDCILEDYTKKDLKCHNCHQLFARLTKYHTRWANKIIRGKVIVKGHYGK